MYINCLRKVVACLSPYKLSRYAIEREESSVGTRKLSENVLSRELIIGYDEEGGIE